MWTMYTTNYQRDARTHSGEFKRAIEDWLCNNHEQQNVGLSKLHDWQWFITFTSKDTMTLNGARLALTRFMGLYLQESKLDEITVFWVAEPHNQGKAGYHVHALLETPWRVPKERRRALQVALLMDDIYQRAMGLMVYHDHHGTIYRDKWARETNKHRFRAEPFSPERAKYCAKYLTKDAILWEFARVKQSEARLTVQEEEAISSLSHLDEVQKDRSGNWDKRAARLRTREWKKQQRLRSGEAFLSIKALLNEEALNYAKFSKLRMNPEGLEMAMAFKPSDGVNIYV